jgi:heat shock protein HtpX
VTRLCLLLSAATLSLAGGLALPLLWPAVPMTAVGGLLLVWLWLLLLAYRAAAPLVLRRFRAVPAEAREFPELHRSAAELARRAGLRVPRLYLVESPVPNAFTTGRDGIDAAVVVTRGLLRLLGPKELRGVLGHELAHLVQRREATGLAASALSGGAALIGGLARSALAYSAAPGPRPGGGRLGAWLARPLAGLAGACGELARSHSRELAADALGGRICGNPLWLAAALRKLQQQDPATEAPGFSLHPPVAERIRRLEAMAYGAYL